MENWPAELPQKLLLGTTAGDAESRLISPMDSGPPSVRSRFTAISQTINTPIILTGAQLAIFNTFYRTTLKHGALSFTWTNPVDNTSATYRFKSPPVWQSARSGDPASRLWRSTLALEILP